MILRFLLLFSLCSSAFAYVQSKSDSGVNLKWMQNENFINIDINPNKKNNQTKDLSENDIFNIINESLIEWNKVSPFSLNPRINTNLNGSEIASIELSDNASLFGSGVLAYTKVEYNNDSGAIIRANIKVNDTLVSTVKFTKDRTNSGGGEVYLGDVISHEVGHLLGLNHTENVKATMLYGPFKGQHTIHSDDIEGIRNVYNLATTGKTINGRVVGGKLVPVFGVNVQAISYSTGEVIQSAITDGSGKFKFTNLSDSDSYYFYLSPVKNKAQLPLYYSGISTNICNGGNFKPSFFSSCATANKGFPSLVKFSNGEMTKDIGDLTIRCDENLESRYLASKSLSEDKAIELIRNPNNFGTVYTGIFFEDEVNAPLGNRYDEFEIDLREEEISAKVALGEPLKLDIKLLGGGIFTALDFEVRVKRADQTSWSTYTSVLDSTLQKPQIDIRLQANLSTSKNDNLFLVRVYPKKIAPLLSDKKYYELFSAPNTLINQSQQYVINTKVVRDTVGGLEPYKLIELSPYEDNKSCTEGDIEATAKPIAQVDPNIDNFSQNSGAPSCGTLSTENDSNGGTPMSLLLGVILSLLFSYILKNSSNILSKS